MFNRGFMDFDQVFDCDWLREDALCIVTVSCCAHVLHPSSPEWLSGGLKTAADIMEHHCNRWLVVRDPKPVGAILLSPRDHIISEQYFIMFWSDCTEKDQIRNIAPPIIYPSERQAFSAELLTPECFPVSALCRLVWTLSIWRCTVKIQSLHWCALWIYTREFITWLASFALFMEQGGRDRNLNADNAVFTLRAIWQHCLHNALVKTPLWVTGGKDNP